MTAAPTPAWGGDPTRFDGWALAGADAVARVLLPLTEEDTGVRRTWREVLAESGRTAELDGYTSWARVTELPGDGDPVPPARYRRAGGLVPVEVLDQLVGALETDPAGRGGWHHVPDPVTAGRAAPLLRAELEEPVLGEAGPTDAAGRPGTGPQDPAAPLRGPLRELACTWATRGFSGRAHSADGRLGLAAPAYADSLVVSGPARVVDALTGSPGIEAHRVSRHGLLPDLVD
jgi:hypothetical protein